MHDTSIRSYRPREVSDGIGAQSSSDPFHEVYTLLLLDNANHLHSYAKN